MEYWPPARRAYASERVLEYWTPDFACPVKREACLTVVLRILISSGAAKNDVIG
jgi:hypothetical protein